MNTNKLKLETMKNQFLNLNFMKTSKFFINAFLCLTFITSFTSCSDDDTPGVVDEEDPVTQLILTFTNQADNTDTIVLTWDDENLNEVVDAGEQTVVGTFEVDNDYSATIELFSGDEDFLEEDILANQNSIDAHFFVYDTDLSFSMERAASDNLRSDNYKLGVNTLWTAGSSAESGEITIQLFHESSTVNDSDGFGTAEGIDTDIDISFDVEVENTESAIGVITKI